MNEVIKIALEIIAGVGGIGVVFTAVVAFSSNFIS